MHAATSAGERRRRLRFAVAAAAVLVLCASPTAASQGVPDEPSDTLEVDTETFGTRWLTGVSVASVESIAALTLYVPQGYAIDLGRPAGTRIGDVLALLRDPLTNDLAGIGIGELTVDDAAKYVIDPAAQACAPGPHAAVWTARLEEGVRSLRSPIFVDVASPADPAGTAYVLRLCPLWPSTSVGVTHLATSHLTIVFDRELAAPTAPGRYTWSALVTPIGRGSIGAEPGRAFEVRAVVRLPQTLTLRAKHNRKAKSVVLSGRLSALGQPQVGVQVRFVGLTENPDDFTGFGPVRTNAAGEFSVRRRVTKTTIFSAEVSPQTVPCAGSSSAPAGCRTETVTPPPPAAAVVRVRVATDPKLAVRARDRALARAANLRISDFPPGWDPFTLPLPLDLCSGFKPDLSALTATGEAFSPAFVTERSAAASRSSVYVSEAQARTALRKEAAMGLVRCLANEVRSDDDYTLTSAGPVPFERVGEETRAFRIAAVDDDGVRTYLDLVSFRRGRVVVHMWFSSADEPLTQLERSVAAAVAARAGRG